MKSLKIKLAIVLLVMISWSCNQHDWEDTFDSEGRLIPGTKRLFKTYEVSDAEESSHNSSGKQVQETH